MHKRATGLRWYSRWHNYRKHRKIHLAVLLVYVLSITLGIFNYPQNVEAAWNYSKTWTARNDFESGTSLTNVALSGDNDEADGNDNDSVSLQSDSDKRKTIATGSNHSMVIKSDGTVWSVGHNAAGQLGIGDNNYRDEWSEVPVSDIVEVAALGEFTLALKSDGTVWGAGINTSGELGDGSTSNRTSFTQARESATTFLTNVKKITAGVNHSIAIKNDGSLWVTGSNAYGQLGLGDTTRRTYWTQVTTLPGLESFELIDIGAGFENSMILVRDVGASSNVLFGAGRNINGELGLADNVQRTSWTSSPLADVVGMGVGYSHTMAIVDGGSENLVWSTGSNGSGRLGIGGGTSVNTWTQTNLNEVAELYPGNSSNLALKKDGSVWGCGDNSVWQLNTGDTIGRYNWVETSYNDLSAASFGTNPHLLILKKNGDLQGVGYNYYDQLGGNDNHFKPSPVQSGFTNPSSIDSGYYNNFLVKNNNLYAAGHNWDYRLGISDSLHRASYSQVPITNVAKSASGDYSTYVLKNDGTLWGVGLNNYGGLGVGNTTYNFSTFQQSKTDANNFLVDVTNIWPGRGHAFAMKSDGTLFGVGLNTNGQLGLGDTTNRLFWTPVVVDGVSKVCPSYSSTAILKNDGTILTSGYNGEGQLGLGNYTQFNSWQTSTTGALDLWCGSHNLFIKKADGIYVTGLNSNGQFGNNSTTTRNIWTKLTALDGLSVAKIAAGNAHTYVLKTDGTMLSTGYNYFGQLGLGDYARRLVWSTFPADGITDVTSGYHHIIYKRSDGTVWGVGSDIYGQLGNGTMYKRALFTTATSVKQPAPFISPGGIVGLKIDAGAIVNWVDILWSAIVPDGTTLRVRTRGAPTEAQLATSEWSVWRSSSGDFVASANSQWLELEVELVSSDGAFSPVLNSLTVNYYSDIEDPTNPTLIQAWKSGAKTDPIDDNGWANSNTFYAEWTGATDSGGSEVGGYWVSFGDDPTADPKSAGSFQESNTFTTELADSDSGKTFYLCISTEDNAGNRYTNDSDPFYKVFTYKFDKTRPDIDTAGIVVAPVGWSVTNNFTFTWQDVDDPLNNGDASGVRGYRYKRKNGSDGWSEETAEKSAANIEAYQNGQNIFELKAIDTAGNESVVKEVFYYYNADAPTVPLNLRVSPQSSTENEFNFTWDPPASANGGVKGYYYSVNALPSRYNSVYITSTSTGTIAAASQQSFNSFYVVAMDNSDNINWGSYSTIQFECNTPAPGSPTTPEIFDTSNRDLQKYSIALSWTEPVQKGAGFNGYILERSLDGENFSQIGTSAGTSYVDAGLQSRAYYYRILSKDNSGNNSAPSTVVSLTPTGRYTSAPAITVDPEVETKVSTAFIRWVTDREASSFVEIGEGVEYGLTQGQFDFVSDHQVSIAGLKPDTIYHYRVKYVDEDGNIGYSLDNTLKTQPAPRVIGLTISEIRLHTAFVSWQTTAPAQSSIKYGQNSNYSSIKSNVSGGFTTSHAVLLTDLEHSSAYHLAILIKDIDDNEVLSDDYSFETQKYPLISMVRMEPVLGTATATMSFTWRTNVPTTSVVRYTPAGGKADEVVAASLATEHKLKVSGLMDNTYYNVVVEGRDQFGNLAQSEANRFKTNYDTRAPKVYNVTSEAEVIGYGVDARGQLAVSWETDEPSTSQVEYGIGSGGEYTNKTHEDATLATSHIVIFSDLKTSSPYHFRVVSRDASGNNGIGEEYAVLTPQATRSVFDAILSTLNNALGWLFAI